MVFDYYNEALEDLEEFEEFEESEDSEDDGEFIVDSF